MSPASSESTNRSAAPPALAARFPAEPADPAGDFHRTVQGNKRLFVNCSMRVGNDRGIGYRYYDVSASGVPCPQAVATIRRYAQAVAEGTDIDGCFPGICFEKGHGRPQQLLPGYKIRVKDNSEDSPDYDLYLTRASELITAYVYDDS